MHKKIISILIFALSCTTLFAQQLPPETAEQWFKVMLNNQKAGYIHHKSEITSDQITSSEVVRISVGRAGSSITAIITESTTFKWQQSSARYKLDSFKSSMEFGPAAVKVDGKLDSGNKYNIIQSIGGNSNTLEMTISDKVQPAESIMNEALKDGINTGITASGTIFSASDMTEVDYKITINEKVKLPEFPDQLFKCSTTMTMRGTPLETISYIDSDGNDVMSTIEMMGMKFQFIVAEMEDALANQGVAEILADVAIKAPADSPDPRQSKAARYNLKFDRPDIDFYHSHIQKITSRDGDKIIIEVKPAQPQSSQTLPKNLFELTPSEAYNLSRNNLAADTDNPQKCFDTKNLWLNYTDPAIRNLAQEAIGTERDAWQAARKIESFVNTYISAKNLDVGWASASDIVKSKSGDCTEHAILTASMCLASGIPARVALGYFYVDQFATVKNAFYGHAWTQVWIAGKWYTIDATRPHQSQCPAYITTLASDGNPMAAQKLTSSFFKVETIEVID